MRESSAASFWSVVSGPSADRNCRFSSSCKAATSIGVPATTATASGCSTGGAACCALGVLASRQEAHTRAATLTASSLLENGGRLGRATAGEREESKGLLGTG